jgi:4'-phosphopantetheinyl transferase
MRFAANIAGVAVVGMLHGQTQSRAGAREQIRLALREMVADALSVDLGRIDIASVAGQRPVLTLDGMAGTAGISLAHDGWISIAAYNALGPVGVDVMQVQYTADWYNVAQDYLGPDVLGTLVATREAERPEAFALAWTAREATLKLHGLALSEWTELKAECALHAIAVPPGYVGKVAVLHHE